MDISESIFFRIILLILISVTLPQNGFIQDLEAKPQLKDSNLKIDIVTDNLSSPTSMAFIGSNILVLEKDGNVRLISNGVLKDEPVLRVNVQTDSERGLLGITVLDNDVFLYFTELLPDGTIKNRVYSYEWNGENLVQQDLLLDLPGLPGPNHDGGKLLMAQPKNNGGPNLFAVIGDVKHLGKLQNVKDGPAPDDTGVIFRVNPQDGSAARDNPFISEDATSRYFAYGIRNSFGMAIDPVTGILWDTENGPGENDEINIVKPGFNSGWQSVMGPILLEGKDQGDLYILPGSHYADPVLTWSTPPGLTAIEFLNSSKLGDNYNNNIFVGDFNNGNLYYFGLNQQREGLKLEDFGAGLSDKMVNNPKELSKIVFGTGFGGITDIKTGPDGFLYILSYRDGSIYRIN